jgi:DNA polymerase
VESCEPFLLRQLQLIGPEVVVALGKFAAQTLLRSKSPISQLRGRWFDYHGIMLMPTFHPAYLLRNPADKRVVWEDIQKVMRVLDLPIAGK